MAISEESASELARRVVADVLAGSLHRTGPQSMHPTQNFHEILASVSELTDPRNRLVHSNGGLFSTGLASARFLFLLSGSRMLGDIMPYSPSVKRFSDDGLTIPGSSYGNRIFGGDRSQFDSVLGILRLRENTKRAAIDVYTPFDAGRESADIPCVMGVVFVPREDKLSLNLLMRANNAIRLLPYNIFEFTMLLEYTASLTGMSLGRYIHSSTSMHVYSSDVPTARILLDCGKSSPPPMATMPKVHSTTRDEIVAAERRLRAACLSSAREVQSEITRLKGELDAYWLDVLFSAAVVLLSKFDAECLEEVVPYLQRHLPTQVLTDRALSECGVFSRSMTVKSIHPSAHGIGPDYT
jgi:thymidylate synthase